MPKTKKRRRRPLTQPRLILKLLVHLRPEMFNFDKPVPLARDVVKDVLLELPNASRRNTRRMLHFWTSRRKYLRALLVPGAYRYHLDGRHAGRVDAVAVAMARKALKSSRRPKPPQDTTEESP